MVTTFIFDANYQLAKYVQVGLYTVKMGRTIPLALLSGLFDPAEEEFSPVF